MNTTKEMLDVIYGSFHIWKAGKHQKESDAPHNVNWFRPNGSELWFFDFDAREVRATVIDEVIASAIMELQKLKQ